MTTPDSALAYRRIFHHEEHVMGTVVTLDLFDESMPPKWTLTPIVEEAIGVLHAADEMFSTWKDTSCISRIRRGELSLDDAPVEISIVLERCRKARETSRGWFDPWAMPGGFDPTGLVKGWAAQQSLNVLQRADVKGAIVNAAGDIASFGGPQMDQRFRIGIADPAHPQQLACVVETPGAIATSGTYERGAHLIDPHSGLPATRAASATVVGTDLSLADALATALVIAGKQALTMFNDLSDYEGLVIADDGTFHMSPGFPIAKL
ncbi:MAG TPA: FAD:protein FMN transferase [Acidimicrobiales bacterium]